MTKKNIKILLYLFAAVAVLLATYLVWQKFLEKSTKLPGEELVEEAAPSNHITIALSLNIPKEKIEQAVLLDDTSETTDPEVAAAYEEIQSKKIQAINEKVSELGFDKPDENGVEKGSESGTFRDVIVTVVDKDGNPIVADRKQSNLFTEPANAYGALYFSGSFSAQWKTEASTKYSRYLGIIGNTINQSIITAYGYTYEEWVSKGYNTSLDGFFEGPGKV